MKLLLASPAAPTARFRHGLCAAAVGLWFAACGAAPALAQAQSPAPADSPCDGTEVRVRATEPEDAAAACGGARSALAFLAGLGIAPDRPIEVELQTQLPPGLRKSAVACYDRRTRRVTVLTYAEFLRRGTWFGLPIERQLHRSAVAHEVAHAVLGCQPGAAALTLPAHEYMAYVTMFGAMELMLRERVLARLGGSGFDHDTQINSLMYGFDPMLFGVNAWRHFGRQPDGRAYFARILAGEILRDELMVPDK